MKFVLYIGERTKLKKRKTIKGSIMKKIAAIDIGTNSMRLLLCEAEGGRIGRKEKDLMVTRIGKGVSATGRLSEKAIDRNVEALKYFRNRAEKFGAGPVIAIATSAVRDAVNREVFVDKAKLETGIDIRVIDGKEEAELGITGVLSDCPGADEGTLVIDIGGGSTELIYYQNGRTRFSASINAGTVRMTESCIKGHPIGEQDKAELTGSLEERFSAAVAALKNKKIEKTVAIGGTATTLGAIFHGLGIYSPEIVHNTVIDGSYVKKIFETLAAMTMEQRFAVKGLQKERADVIPAGIRILDHLLASLGLKQVVISENDNLEGAVIKYVLRDGGN